MRGLYTVIFLFFVHSVFAQSRDPLQSNDYTAQNQWVDSVYNSMDLDHKIGQLFMIQAYSNKNQKHEKEIKSLIRKYHVGGIIFMQGTPQKQAQLTNDYQEISKLPMLVGFDGEWGLDMRLKNSFRYPWNMTLGAIQDNSLIEQMGEQVGKHCKRIGIHVNFAPVVDINTNPLNPIIGNRSFGENKDNVAQKAVAFSKGMQSVGVLANVKHFPGHGDTETDSHLGLPVLNFDRERLDSLELYPFQKTFEKGVASVMTGHLSVPVLESNPKMPTSLSKPVITDLLKGKLGFNGLIFTDALNMKGAANFASPSQINLAALNAGNDVLLIPHEIPETIALIKKSLTNKTLEESRIEEAVKKILKAKYLVGLNNYKPLELNGIVEGVNTIEDQVLHQKLVKSSMTIIKNYNQILPIKNLEANKKIAYVQLGSDKESGFVETLRKYTNVTRVSDSNLSGLISKLKEFDLVVVGFHTSNKNPWKSYKFTNQELIRLNEISRENKTILTVFSSPYSLLDIKSFSNIEGVLVAYQNSNIAQKVAAQAIFGAIPVNGKLPVSIKENFSVGTGFKTQDLHRLEYTLPETVGMSSKRLEYIDSLAKIVIDEKMAPGLQVLVARYGKVVYQKSFGFHTSDKKIKVDNSHVYDLASLTKILASLPLIMKAEEEDLIKLDDRLGNILPSAANSNKSDVTVKEILAHVGGLKSWIPFYRFTQEEKTKRNLPEFYRSEKTGGYSVEVAKNLYLHNSYKDTIMKRILEADQREKKGYKYSDLGYYLFQEVLEEKYKKPLDVLLDENFYNSLGAYRTGYNPLRDLPEYEIVPTENDDYYRKQLLRGYVHDMGAAMYGGVAGHAGLFANANDVAKIMQMYLQKGYYGGKQYFKSSTLDKFNKRHFLSDRVRRGLGFDKPQLTTNESPTCGCTSDYSFGHSGFTGTYTWADPVSGVVYVFLSNRVYPTMNNKKLLKENIRTRIQRVIQNAIVDE